MKGLVRFWHRRNPGGGTPGQRPGAVSPGCAFLTHSKNCGAAGSPSAGAQVANSEAVAGSYGPSLISRNADPSVSATSVCQVARGVSYAMLAVSSPTEYRAVTVPRSSTVRM